MLIRSRVFLLVVLIFSTVGCGGGPTSGPIQTTITIGDRQISTFLDIPGDIQKDGESAVVTAGAVKVMIEKERVLIDGNDSGVIPAAAKRVDVTITSNVLTVNADDTVVATKAIHSKDVK